MKILFLLFIFLAVPVFSFSATPPDEIFWVERFDDCPLGLLSNCDNWSLHYNWGTRGNVTDYITGQIWHSPKQGSSAHSQYLRSLDDMPDSLRYLDLEFDSVYRLALDLKVPHSATYQAAAGIGLWTSTDSEIASIWINTALDDTTTCYWWLGGKRVSDDWYHQDWELLGFDIYYSSDTLTYWVRPFTPDTNLNSSLGFSNTGVSAQTNSVKLYFHARNRHWSAMSVNNIFFMGGGEWDSFPFIGPVWYPDIPDYLNFIRPLYQTYASSTDSFDVGFWTHGKNESDYPYVCARNWEIGAVADFEIDCVTATSTDLAIGFQNINNPFEFSGLSPGDYKIQVGFATSTTGALLNAITHSYSLVSGESFDFTSYIDYDYIDSPFQGLLPFRIFGYEIDLLKPVYTTYKEIIGLFPFSWLFEFFSLINYYRNNPFDSGSAFVLDFTIPEGVALAGTEIKLVDFESVESDYPSLVTIFSELMFYGLWLGFGFFIVFRTLGFAKGLRKI